MSDEDDSEIVSESYRRRVRVMGRLLAPFDIVDLIVSAGGVIAVIALALKAWT